MVEPKLSPTVERLITLLRDGEKGFRLLSEKVSHAECRAFLWEESQLRGLYADELQRSLGQPAGAAHGAGTRLGTLHRGWTVMKAMLGASDYALLETIEICEWFAAETYDEALRAEAVPAEVTSRVAGQAKSVHRSQAIVKEFRRITRKQPSRGGRA